MVGTATVTTQGPRRRLRHDAKGEGFYPATSGDLDLATSGDFFMATDTGSARSASRHHHRRGLHASPGESLSGLDRPSRTAGLR